MVDQSNRIFLTKENLAFSAPLILICAVYSYFKFIPLVIGIPFLIFVFVVFQIRALFQKQREKKLTNLDESAIKELIGEDDRENKQDGAAVRKAKSKVKQRLAQERKDTAKQNKGSKTKEADDDDIDTDALLTFAGQSAAKKKK